MKIVETFLSIAGEGQLIGQPSVFIRAFGCDYACRGCDTDYAKVGAYKELTPDEIVEQVIELSSGEPILVTLTGGNPCLQDFSEVILQLHGRNYPVAVETQGSIACSWLGDLDFLTLSPKSASSGNMTNFAQVVGCIESFGKTRGDVICVKIVIADAGDLDYAQSMFSELSAYMPYSRISQVVQPFNGSTNPHLAELQQNYARLVEVVLKRKMFNVRVLPQMHRFGGLR